MSKSLVTNMEPPRECVPINPCLSDHHKCLPPVDTPITSLTIALPIITLFFLLMAGVGVGVSFIKRIPDSR